MCWAHIYMLFNSNFPSRLKQTCLRQWGRNPTVQTNTLNEYLLLSVFYFILFHLLSYFKSALYNVIFFKLQPPLQIGYVTFLNSMSSSAWSPPPPPSGFFWGFPQLQNALKWDRIRGGVKWNIWTSIFSILFSMMGLQLPSSRGRVSWTRLWTDIWCQVHDCRSKTPRGVLVRSTTDSFISVVFLRYCVYTHHAYHNISRHIINTSITLKLHLWYLFRSLIE